jgi:anti-sigma B factor antagonist
MKQLFSCTVLLNGEGIVAYLDGELDMNTAECLVARIAPLAVGGHDVTVNLSGLTFLGTIGVVVLADLSRCATAAGGSIRLAEMTELVLRVLSVTGMQDRFTVAQTVESKS